jgi:prepilin signal peptidase PulO-like enzyme (type II secretory pathway)
MDATVWVVLLILASVFGTLIGFIIVLVIYLVVRESHPVGGMPYGYGYPPPGAPPPAGAPPLLASCPVCGNPMTWYPQYARWYCPTCAQYR